MIPSTELRFQVGIYICVKFYLSDPKEKNYSSKIKVFIYVMAHKRRILKQTQ